MNTTKTDELNIKAMHETSKEEQAKIKKIMEAAWKKKYNKL